MSYVLGKIKLNIAKEINKALKGDFARPEDLAYPPNAEMGDLSLACFELFKKIKESVVSVQDAIERPERLSSPAELASWLAVETRHCLVSTVDSVKAAGPYLNFILNKDYLVKDVLTEIGKEKKKYGENKSGRGKRVMVEYSNANTHKEYHIGHLRNICFGDAVNRILAANGHKTIPVSYINDFGIHVAKTLWVMVTGSIMAKGSKSLLKALRTYKGEKNKPSFAKATEGKGYILGQLYSQAVKELENNDLGKQMVALMMKKIESRQGEEYKLWQRTRKWSIEYMAQIYKELGVEFSRIFYESEVIDKGKKMVNDLLRKGFLSKSEGAVIADLNKYNLGVVVFLRADGTALYPTADIPLAILKFKKYKLDKSVYVVDIRQSLYFKQLFKIMELLGVKKEMLHLGYEFVKLPSGMMSSRTGNVITYEDLRVQLREHAIGETKKRHKDWSEKKINEVTNKLVNGAMKFEMLKVSREQVITFDIKAALRFDGFTAGYLQYTYARIRSIIKKNSKLKTQISKPQLTTQNLKIDFNKLSEKGEYSLVMKMAKYPEIVERAGESHNPAELAKYLFELAQIFNDYYHSVPVLRAEDGAREARLVLIRSVSQIITNGLRLLGIEVMEEM